MSDQAPVAFFDVTSLGSLRRSFTGEEPGALEPYPDVRAVLEALSADGVQLGVAATPGLATGDQLTALLERDGFAGLLAPQLTIARAGPEGFASIVDTAGAAIEPARSVFVCEDRDLRSDALAAGLQVAPHPRLAAAALAGRRLRYVRVSVPREHLSAGWRQAMLELELVPLHVAGEEGAVIYAIATATAAAELDDLGFQAYRLGAPDEPLTTDVYVLRDDRQARTGFLVPAGSSSERLGTGEGAERVLASTRRGLYVAIPAGRSVETYHFDEARHGHTEKLLPDTGLLERFEELAAPTWLGPPTAERALAGEERSAFAGITPEGIAADLARYVGSEAIDEAGTRIRSRHILSPDNAVAVATLARDLEAIGLTVTAHSFLHEGRSLANVEAELPGSDHDGLVLVTAHLDSTAAFSGGFDPVHDPAPGADDDASGMVAVLAVARAFAELAKRSPPKRPIRFLLFNAEEHGLVGSRAYARDQAALGAPISAVFQMDMIGYNREPPRTFEVHAGFLPSAEVQRRSLVLAARIARAVEELSLDLPAPQVYASESAQLQDPAEGRSDHASFQLVGYAACATSEDFFAGPAGGSTGPEPEPNPNYHMSSDTFVDFDYAAQLARAVAAAAWMSANS